VKPKTFMLIAGEASGDLLAAELVSALNGKLSGAKFVGTASIGCREFRISSVRHRLRFRI
jgi:lipid A disaccharide synthetase